MLTTPGTGLANFGVTQLDVNAAVAGLGATVVHLAGTETITGTKQFSVPPSLPTPVGANDAANKGYVDGAVSSVGSGAYVAIAGGTMTGPLTLPADVTGETATSDSGDRPYRMSASFAWNYVHQNEFLSSRSRRAGYSGSDTYYAKLPPSKVFPYGYAPGATGGAWSWRRDAFETVGGMLDTCVLGSADWHMAFGLVQATNVAAEMKRCTQPYVESVLNWQARAAKLNRVEGRSPMGCIDNFATHAFHGSKALRAYGERWALLQKWDFNPATDIARDYQGLWRWTGNKPGLRDDVARYFIERSEDGPLLLGGDAVGLTLYEQTDS